MPFPLTCVVPVRPEPGDASVNHFCDQNGSATTVHCDLESLADLTHPLVAEPAQSFDKDSDRDALDRVEIYSGQPWNGIVAGFENDLAGKAANSRRARGHQRASKSRDCSVAREDHNRAATDVRQLTPPDLPSGRKRGQEAAAASRNDAKSPHTSGSSSGCSSYAA